MAQGAVDLSAPVSAEYRATRLELLLPALSKEWKIPLRCEPALENTPLILRVDRAPLKEAMDKIAEAMVGKWVKMPQGWELRRDLDLQEKLEAEYRAATLRHVQKNLDEWVASLVEKPWDERNVKAEIEAALERERQNFTTGGSPPPYVNNADPYQRLGARLLQAIGAEALVSLPVGTRSVFATQPTALQHPFGDGFNSAWKVFVSESELQDRLAQGAELRKQNEYSREPVLSRTNWRDVAKVMVEVELASQPSPQVFYADIVLRSFDQAGKVLVARPVPLSSRTAAVDSFRNAVAVESSEPIQVDEMTAYVLSVVNWSRKGGPPPRPSESISYALAHPEIHDPLSFFASVAFLEVAKRKHLNFAGVVPDSIGALYARLRVLGELKPQTFLNLIARDSALRQKLETAWWIASTPIDGDEPRLDRKLFGNAVRQVLETRKCGARERAVLDAHSEGMSLLLWSQLSRLEPGGFDWLIDGRMHNEQLWRLIGILTDSQWGALERGEALPFDTLTSRQGETLGLFIASHRDVIEGASEPRAYETSPLAADATQRWYEGLPEGGYMLMKSEPWLRVSALRERGNQSRTEYSAELAADARILKERPDLTNESWSRMEPLPERFQVARSRILSFEFHVEPGIVLKQQVKDTVPPDPRPLTYSELPEEYRRKVDEHFKQQVKWLSEDGDGGS